MRYKIEFAESIREHFRSLTSSQRTLVLEAIEKQLGDEPLVETRNRKPLRPNPLAPWELRIGELRVFYDVIFNEVSTVQILAIGIKRRNKLLIAGEEVSL